MDWILTAVSIVDGAKYRYSCAVVRNHLCCWKQIVVAAEQEDAVTR